MNFYRILSYFSGVSNDFSRLLRLFHIERVGSARLESVEQHRQWQATLDQEDFFDEVFGPLPTNQEQ